MLMGECTVIVKKLTWAFTRECRWCASHLIASANNTLGCCLNQCTTGSCTLSSNVNVRHPRAFINGRMAVSPDCMRDATAPPSHGIQFVLNAVPVLACPPVRNIRSKSPLLSLIPPTNFNKLTSFRSKKLNHRPLVLSGQIRQLVLRL